MKRLLYNEKTKEREARRDKKVCDPWLAQTRSENERVMSHI